MRCIMSGNLETIPRRAESLKRFCMSFGISYDTGYRAVKDGRLRAILLGNRWFITAPEIERVCREGLGRQAEVPTRGVRQ